MNIYNIEQELIAIFDEIEENGGEITPELEKELAIKQDEFKEKVENYTKVIKLLEQDINSRKEEKKRLTDLATSKQKIIDRLTKVIIEAVNNFGETRKTGVKYLDYGTGSVSIRTTKSVYVDDELLDKLGKAIALNLGYNKETNQLDVIDKLAITPVLDLLDTDITQADIEHTKLNLSIDLPTTSIFDGSGYNVIKEIAKYTSQFDLTPIVSKTELRKELEEDGSCTPYLAKLNINKSIQIK